MPDEDDRVQPPLRAGDLPGWRAVSDEPGIAEIAPVLDGLDVIGRVDAPALVKRGDAVRSTSLIFATEADAAEAFARARDDNFKELLVALFHGRIRRVATAGYRLTVTRPGEPGRDTVEVYAIRRGRELVLVELLSGAGFAPALRERVLAAVSR